MRIYHSLKKSQKSSSSNHVDPLITHPEKILFPEDGYTKLDVIDYYAKVSPFLLKHINRRALTLKRFPRGIGQPGFFQKNKPSNTPEWIPSIRTGIKKSDFLVINGIKSLKWLINQNTIELHQSTGRIPLIDYPDYIVFDLDPPINAPFELVAGVAEDLNNIIKKSGCSAFLKTSGGKGLHILIPILPKVTAATTLKIAGILMESMSVTGATTTEQRKFKRGNKIYIDLSRNYQGQTIVSPYSLRARLHAPVSTPLTWRELPVIENPSELNLKSVSRRIISKADPWENFRKQSIDPENFRIKEP